MNRFLKLGTIFFVSIFSLFFTLSVEANEFSSKRYRDSFSNAPSDSERERPVEKGEDSKKDDRGTKGGKTGKRKKKKVDISIPPRSGNEGSLVITLEAKSAQLTSFSNNGFSEPGAPVILDPNSLSLASSGRDLFDQVRGGFIGEGGKIFVDKNGLVEGFDPGINQFTGSFGTGSFLGGQEQDYMEVDHPIITSYKIGSGGGSSAPTGLMKLGSAIKEIGSDVIDFGLAASESPYTPHGLTNLSLRWAANQQAVLLTSGLEKLGYNTTVPSFFIGGENINGFQFGSYWTVEGHTVESGDAKAAAGKLASLVPIGRAYAAGRWGLSALGRVPAALQTVVAWGRVAWGRAGSAAIGLSNWVAGAAGSTWGWLTVVVGSQSPGMLGTGALQGALTAASRAALYRYAAVAGTTPAVANRLFEQAARTANRLYGHLPLDRQQAIASNATRRLLEVAGSPNFGVQSAANVATAYVRQAGSSLGEVARASHNPVWIPPINMIPGALPASLRGALSGNTFQRIRDFSRNFPGEPRVTDLFLRGKDPKKISQLTRVPLDQVEAQIKRLRVALRAEGFFNWLR